MQQSQLGDADGKAANVTNVLAMPLADRVSRIFMDSEYRRDLISPAPLPGIKCREIQKSKDGTMGFCDHCQGQRFDRAQVLRALRTARQRLRRAKSRTSADHALELAIQAVRALDIPHLEIEDDEPHGDWIH